MASNEEINASQNTLGSGDAAVQVEAPDFGQYPKIDESQPLIQATSPDTADMQDYQNNFNGGPEEEGKVKLNPMTPFAASSTVINLLLATGPFSYPYSYVAAGPVLCCIIIGITAFLAYISATYMMEAISVSQTRKPRERQDSIFGNECYATPIMQRKMQDPDVSNKDSPYYIREKLELGIMAERIGRPWVKYAIIIIMIIYMYGAMSLKYVAGAQSLYQGTAFLVTGKETAWDDVGYVYYVSIAIFGSLSILFSFGDIENSKNLQIFTGFMRVFILLLFYIGAFYYIVDQPNPGVTWNFKEQFPHLSTVFGNTVFVFIYHHSIPGIVYPIRPQSSVNRMFLISNIIGACLLALEGQLAFWAFGGIPYNPAGCVDKIGTDGKPIPDTAFPCATQPLYNENFQKIPVIGQICVFYPMLNVSAVPILVITLRNNLLKVVPFKKWIARCSPNSFLLDDHKAMVKGVWAGIFSIPAIIIVMFTRDPQVIVTYTGGIAGTFILFLIPLTLVAYARKVEKERTPDEAVRLGDNPNKSPFRSMFWWYTILGFSCTTLFFVMWGIIEGNAGE